MKRSANAEWSGDLKTGKGKLNTDSGVLSGTPYGFNTRFENEKGTNPEELIGAAHAGCFSMALSNELGKVGITPQRIVTKADVNMETGGGTITIDKIHLTVEISAPGADETAVRKAADDAKAGCPVSKLLNAEITMNATINV